MKKEVLYIINIHNGEKYFKQYPAVNQSFVVMI